MTARGETLALVLFGGLVALVAATGIGARATYGAHTTADEPQYLLSAMSLWEDGDLDISDELADQRYRAFHEADLPQQTMLLDDGRRVSPHDALLPLIIAAPMGLGGWPAAKATLALLGGATAALTVWAARRRLGVSGRAAYLTVAVFALAPPFAVYSTQVYPEIPAGLALVAGVAALLGPFRGAARVIFALAVISLPWLAVKYVPVAAALATAGMLKARSGRRLLLASFAVAGLVYVAAHLLLYGGLTAYAAGDHFVGGELTAVGADVDLWGRSTRLLGLMVDRGFGIGAWQPAFLLLLPAAGWAVRRGRRAGVMTGMLAVGWLVATFVALTMHGWWFPGRQLVVVLPLAFLLVAMWADDAPGRRLPAVVLIGAAGVAAYLFLVVEGLGGALTWVVDFGSTANPVYRALSGTMPDYLAPTSLTWPLHSLWVAASLALVWLGWRQAGGGTGGEQPAQPEADRYRDGDRERTLA